MREGLLSTRTTLSMLRERLTAALGLALLLLGAAGASGAGVSAAFGANTAHYVVWFSSGLVATVVSWRSGRFSRAAVRSLAVGYAALAALGFVFPEEEVLGVLTSGFESDLVNAVAAGLFAVAGFWSASSLAARPAGEGTA